MHVRLTRIEGVIDVDQAVVVVREDILPAVKGLKGFRGTTASADRPAGVVVILTVWDSEADEKASADKITKLREDSAKAIGGHLAEVRAYDQLIEEVATAPKPGCPLVVTPNKMDPAQIEDNIEFFKAKVLPGITSIPGFCSIRSLMDRKTGEGLVGVVFRDDASVKEYEAQGQERRQRATGQGVELAQPTRREIIFTG